METYPIEVDPEQIVDWIMAESLVAPHEFRVSARRAFETRELPTRKELRLGEAEREDLTEVAVIGTCRSPPRTRRKGGSSQSSWKTNSARAFWTSRKQRGKSGRSTLRGFIIHSFVPAGGPRAHRLRWRARMRRST